MKRILLTAILLLMASGSQLFADRATAREYAYETIYALEDNGYTVKDGVVSYMSQGDSTTYTITMYANVSYMIVGVGDGEISDLDITIYDENGYEITKDTDVSNIASGEINPAWSGPFHIKVKSYAGSGYFSLVVAWK